MTLSVCVFCSSAGGLNEVHRQAARDLGAELAERGHRLVYGGGDVGLMGEVARSLGFEVDRSRSKDSRWWAIHPSGRRFPIPTTNNPVRVGTTTSILRVLEEVLNDVSPG